tara:strand:- start:16908 stop:17021 length:114 start_codon:yes stop_codon:yes gene_type:complete
MSLHFLSKRQWATFLLYAETIMLGAILWGYPLYNLLN